jgi:hypothetical protein
MIKIETHRTFYTLDQGAPAEERRIWEEQLALVHCGTKEPLVGILEYSETDEYDWALYGALTYLIHVEFAVDPNNNALRLHVPLRTLIPFGVMSPANIKFPTPPTAVMWIKDQPETVKKWFCDTYLAVFDPPRIITSAVLPPR